LCSLILASTGNFTYDCAVWLNEVLAPIREHSTNIKDDFEFITKLEQSKIFNSDIMVLFDVKSLFTNILTKFAIDLILQQILDTKEALFFF